MLSSHMPSRQSARRLLGAAALRHFSETIEELGGGGGCPFGGPRERLRSLRPAPGQESLQGRYSAPGGPLRGSAHGERPRGGGEGSGPGGGRQGGPAPPRGRPDN